MENASEASRPGYVATDAELRREGFLPFDLDLDLTDLAVSSGIGCTWTTIGDVPTGPGLYAFTVNFEEHMRVMYVGLTEELWMVTKGRLPTGGSRPGQRYGRPRYAGVTRERINVLVATHARLGHHPLHWLRPMSNEPGIHENVKGFLRANEEEYIRRWELRRVGWNRG